MRKHDMLSVVFIVSFFVLCGWLVLQCHRDIVENRRIDAEQRQLDAGWAVARRAVKIEMERDQDERWGVTIEGKTE